MSLRKGRIKFFTYSISFLALFFLNTSFADENPTIYKITILHTNDHHGRFFKNDQKEYGLSAQKTLVDSIRKEVKNQGGHTLLLSAGDVNTGVPESDMQHAEPDFKAMSLIGYDAMALGNHEFDKPRNILFEQKEWANFPFLSANIYKQDGTRLMDASKIFYLGDVRIAVLGLTTEDTAKIVNPERVKDLVFRSPINEAAREVPKLRAQADIVIALSHMGHYPDGIHGNDAPGDVEMARAVSGIDLIVGGHSQNPLCMLSENKRNENYAPGMPCVPDRQNGTWIVQAHEWGKYLGRADFEFQKGKLTLVKYALIPINLKNTNTQRIEEDEDLLEFLEPYHDKGQAALNKTVGQLEGKFEGDRNKVRYGTTNLSHFMGQAMLKKSQGDVAVLNGGGIRDSIPSGPVTYKSVLQVFPFGGTIVYVDMSGDEAQDYLETIAQYKSGSGSFAHLVGATFGNASSRTQIFIGNKPIIPTKTYRIVLNSFIAAGGDGYPAVNHHPQFVNTGFVDAALLKDAIQTQSPIKTSDFE